MARHFKTGPLQFAAGLFCIGETDVKGPKVSLIDARGVFVISVTETIQKGRCGNGQKCNESNGCGADFLIDGGAAASYFYGALKSCSLVYAFFA